MIKRTAPLILAVCILAALPGCGRREPVPADTIEAFQDAFNQYSLDKMLDCVNPPVAEIIRAVLDSGERSGSLRTALLTALLKIGFPVLPLLTNGRISYDALPKLDLKCADADIDGDSAAVPVDGTLTVDGHSLEFQVTASLIRGENGKWFLTGVSGGDGTEESGAAAEALPAV